MVVRTAFRCAGLVFGVVMLGQALASPVDSSAEGATWLRSQPAQNFTLQLVAVDTPERVGLFVRRHHLSGELAQLRVRQGAGTGYILVLGSYPDRKAASDAAAGLSVKPWIRGFGGIQRIVLEDASTPPLALPAPVEQPVKDSAWIWSQDPSHYTLQLAAGANHKALEKLADRVTGQGPVAIYAVARKGKTSYAVTFGDFASNTDAQEALKLLPPAVRQGHPAVRTFASIHDAMSLGGN